MNIYLYKVPELLLKSATVVPDGVLSLVLSDRLHL